MLLRDDIQATLACIAPHAARLGSSDALAHLSRTTKAVGDAEQLRIVHEHEGSVEAMVNLGLRRFRGEF